MKYVFQPNEQYTETVIQGRFTFNDHHAFRGLLDKMLGCSSASRHILDLSQVEFIDSAGLGMLLIAKEETAKAKSSIEIRNPSGQVQKILEIAKFTDLFSIQS